jgi:transposase-like protein
VILEQRKCEKCSSENLIRNGKNASGSQRYRCKDCGVTRVLDKQHASAHIDQEMVERSYLERNSLRATARIFNVHHVTVWKWLKKRLSN